MATNESDRLEIFHRLYNFAHMTDARVPLTDWYDTVHGSQNGFQARPVVGALYGWILLQSQRRSDMNKAMNISQVSSYAEEMN